VLDALILCGAAAGWIALRSSLVPWSTRPWEMPFWASLLIVAVPAILAEARLTRHLARHAASEPNDLEGARQQMLSRNVGARARLLSLGGLAMLASAIAYAGEVFTEENMNSLFFGNTLMNVPESVRWIRDVGFRQLPFAIPLVGYLHLARRAVVRHERLALKLTEGERADAPIEVALQDWRERYTSDALLSIAALLPVVGIPAIVAIAARLSGTLALHEKHEAAPERGEPRAMSDADATLTPTSDDERGPEQRTRARP
jgi:hypothetical protein